MKGLKTKKGNILLYIILLVLVLVTMYSIRNCSNNLYPYQRIGASQGDTLDVAILYSPMSYYLYDDTIGGFNYDMLRLYAEDEDKNIRFWPIVGLDDALDKLDKRQFDILASLPIDQDFDKKYSYTTDVFLDRQVLIQRRNANGRQSVTSSLDLANETIHIERDSPIEFRIRNLSKEIGDTIYTISHPELSAEYLFLKVASGDMKYAVINERVARPLLTHYPEVSIDTPISFTQFQAWIVSRQDTILLNSLNQWIDSVRNTQKYEIMMSKYNAMD